MSRSPFAALLVAVALTTGLSLARWAAAQDVAPDDRRQRAEEAAQRIAAQARRQVEPPVFEHRNLREEIDRRVDVVLLLDCSGSMRFALDSARTQFWRIATSISAAQPRPRLRIGLMAYGLRDQEFPIVPLSEDLVGVFDELLRLDISRAGGDEWIGEAMLFAGGRFWSTEATQKAMAMLAGPGAGEAEGAGDAHASEASVAPTRLYFIFGNETVYQGPSNPVEVARGVPPLGRVNTVHCISAKHTSPHDAEGWTALAEAGQGVAMRLDTTGDPMLIVSPYDRDLARLSRRLTESYIPLGVLGQFMVDRRRAVEEAATQWPKSLEADYASAMAAWQQNEEIWDFAARVMEILKESDPRTHEAILRGNEYFIDLEAVREAVTFVEPELLPPEFARMKVPERAAAVAKAAIAREELRREIDRLSRARRSWILRKAAEEAARRHWRWQLVLDLEKALRGPLREAGYAFPDEE